MRSSAQERFEELTRSESPNWLVHLTDITIGDLPVGLAKDPNGRPAVLVPAPARRAEVKLLTKGLLARVGALMHDGAYSDWLMVTCQTKHFDITFFKLCDDVLATLGSLPNGVDPVDATMAVVEHWKDLLADVSGTRLTVEQCAGLLVELHTLELLAATNGAVAALDSWAGPDKARVDFRFPGRGIEVKATLQRERFKVTVHGLWQLDEVEVGDLYLFAQQLEQVPDGGDTLPEVVDRLVSAGVPKQELFTRLDAVGYSRLDQDHYRSLHFKVLDERCLLVSASTPRIVKSSFAEPAIAESISAVTYALDLTDMTEAEGRLKRPREIFGGVDA